MITILRVFLFATLAACGAVIVADAAALAASEQPRAWLSWDGSGCVTRTRASLENPLRLYVHLENVSDVRELALALRWNTGDTVTCVSFVSSSPETTSGWATQEPTSRSFRGDNSFNWRIQFPNALRARNRIVFTVSPGSCPLPPRVRFSIAGATIVGSGYAVDTIRIVGDAVLETVAAGAQPEASQTHRILARLDAGALGYDGSHVVIEDFRSIPVRASLRSLGFQSGRRLFPVEARADTAILTEGGVVIRLPDPTLWYVLEFDGAMPVDSVTTKARRIPGLRSARTLRQMEALRTPDDLHWRMMWFLPTMDSTGQSPTQNGQSVGGINAEVAWDAIVGSDSVLIGVVDSGIDYVHPDLDPGNRSRVIHGYDFGELDEDPMDVNGHGTGVSGFAAAWGNNSVLLAGTIWRARILPVKVTTGTSINGTEAAIGAGLQYAQAVGAQIINLSMGSPAPIEYTNYDVYRHNNPEDDPVVYGTLSAFANGAALFMAAGNTATGTVYSPALLPWACAVSGSATNGLRQVDLNYGEHLDVIAPHRYSWSLGLGGTVTNTMSGTSTASPVAAGVGALVLAYALRNGITITNEDIYGIVKRSATDVGLPGWDVDNGWGRVSAARAVSFLRAPFSMLRETRTGGTATLTRANYRVEIGVPLASNVLAGLYYVDKYEVRQHVSACGQYSEEPKAWARTLACRGYDAGSTLDEFLNVHPWGEVLNESAAGFDVRTYVYFFRHTVAGQWIGQWFPCPPQEALLAYTSIGRIPVQGVSISSDGEPPCAFLENTWHSNVCGSDVASYEWRESIDGGPWSSVLATTPDYTGTVPLGPRRLQVTAIGPSGTAQGEIDATGYLCYTDVPEAGRILELKLSHNPARAGVSGSMTIKTDGPVRLQVFDMAGRRIKSILGEAMRAGQYRWAWRGDDHAGQRVGAGVYFIALDSGGEARRERVVLLR